MWHPGKTDPSTAPSSFDPNTHHDYDDESDEQSMDLDKMSDWWWVRCSSYGYLYCNSLEVSSFEYMIMHVCCLKICHVILTCVNMTLWFNFFDY